MSVDTMALIVMSNLPACASSNHTETCTVRRVRLDVEGLLQHGLDGRRPLLEGRRISDQEIYILDPHCRSRQPRSSCLASLIAALGSD